MKDKGSKIADLKSQLKDKESEIQSTNGANKKLQEELKQSEAELNVKSWKHNTEGEARENREKFKRQLWKTASREREGIS